MNSWALPILILAAVWALVEWGIAAHPHGGES